jgi:hypothetical protein
MTETNLPTGNDKRLDAAAQALLDAAMAYWKEYKRATGGAAVVWVKDTDGRMVVMTRGEYADTILHNVDSLNRDIEALDPQNSRLTGWDGAGTVLHR